jgi:polysaccharide pyruvyl transferase WcaK-like protein
MARMCAAVSMRLHGLIFGEAVGLPLIGIVYDPKVNNFLDYIGQSSYCDIKAVTYEGLCSMLDSVMAVDNSETARRMYNLEKINREVLVELLNER